MTRADNIMAELWPKFKQTEGLPEKWRIKEGTRGATSTEQIRAGGLLKVEVKNSSN